MALVIQVSAKYLNKCTKTSVYTLTSSNCQCAVELYHLFMIIAVFDVSLIACRC